MVTKAVKLLVKAGANSARLGLHAANTAVLCEYSTAPAVLPSYRLLGELGPTTRGAGHGRTTAPRLEAPVDQRDLVQPWEYPRAQRTGGAHATDL